MISLSKIEQGIDFPYSVTDIFFDYIPKDVPPCIYFDDIYGRVSVCSLPVSDLFFSDKHAGVVNALKEKTSPFNGLPKTHLNELEIMWIGFEGNIVNNIQISGHWLPYLSRQQQRIMYKSLIDNLCIEETLIPTVATMRARALELNTKIMETPYSSSVYDGPKVIYNEREFRLYTLPTQ